MRRTPTLSCIAACTFLPLAAASAQPAFENIRLDSAVVSTYQNTDEDGVGGEALGSLDVVVTTDFGPGKLVIYGEGSTSPQPGDVSSAFGEVNGDAGSALDGQGDGRLQISEFRYSLPLMEGGHFTFGLLDATVYLDTTSHANPTAGVDFSGIANDETSQFLGNSFVNNPIVEFPDYTLGFALGKHAILGNDRFGLQAVLTSSNGLADNPNASYSELFDVGDDGKGVFADVEAHYQNGKNFLARLGVWTNTRDHDRVDGTPAQRSNYGIYSTIEGKLGPGNYNVRLGWSDPDVSAGETFVSLATEQPLSFANAGFGLAYTGASGDLGPGSDDTLHAEAYLRFDVLEWLQVSPDIQYIENSGFDESVDAFVYGVRLAAFFGTG